MTPEAIRTLKEQAARADVAEASRDALAACLRDVLRVVDAIGGYLSPEQQAAVRVARARVTESEGDRP